MILLSSCPALLPGRRLCVVGAEFEFSVVYELFIVRNSGQEVKELVVWLEIRPDELLRELVDAPDDDEESGKRRTTRRGRANFIERIKI